MNESSNEYKRTNLETRKTSADDREMATPREYNRENWLHNVITLLFTI